MGNRVLEFISGLFVLIVIIIFLNFSISSILKDSQSSYYTLNANFSNVGGITNGSFVMLNGIKVGLVESVKINEETLKVNVKMRVDEGLMLPDDTSAMIDTADLLGGKVLILETGISKTYLKNGETIINTKSFVSLEQRIGDILLLVTK